MCEPVQCCYATDTPFLRKRSKSASAAIDPLFLLIDDAGGAFESRLLPEAGISR